MYNYNIDMYSAFRFGYPKTCCNTNCKEKFLKNSHLGWLPRNEIEVYAILFCKKCNSKFKIAQNLSDSFEYYKKLEGSSKKIASKITNEEIIEMKKQLSNKKILPDLNSGMIPGISQALMPGDEDES